MRGVAAMEITVLRGLAGCTTPLAVSAQACENEVRKSTKKREAQRITMAEAKANPFNPQFGRHPEQFVERDTVINDFIGSIGI
jgi:hypothetical protein